MKRLNEKTALITGAARGIGFEFARKYIEEGANVVLTDINEERVKEAAQSLGQNTLAVKMDVTSQSSIEKAIQETIEQFGGIDILINNAAIFSANPIEDTHLLNLYIHYSIIS